MQVCLLKLKVEEKRKGSNVLSTKYQPLDININPNVKFEIVAVHKGGMVWL